jgi:hypothetical protein
MAKLPYPISELGWVTMTLWQPNNPNEPITKTLDDCDSPDDSKEFCVDLTAEETARFSEKYKAKVQLRGQHTESGKVFGSLPQLITVYPMLEDIIDEDPLPEGFDEVTVFDGKTID